ncbi:dihydromonapterin reductase [Neptuniibacter sp. QD34_54]|uniref:dihydromonapterin reductase n=1 Tax=Neptuniibacter sp. QD34_54 TaxID=3398208 RepID=UPI0039F64356
MVNNSKPILITGVGKRIGFALGKHFIQHGIPVIGTYRTYYDNFEEISDADLIECDFYKQEDLNRLIDHVKSNYTSLRGIIHNASDWLPETSKHSADDIFNKMMMIHAGVPYQLNLALKPLLENCESTTDIINITDYVVDKGSDKHIAYAASKAALSNMTLSFSSLLAPKIKVNAIAPSLIMFNPEDDSAYKAKALDKSLLKIAPGTEEIIKAVDYLLDSKYMTGRTLSLDGGRHIR